MQRFRKTLGIQQTAQARVANRAGRASYTRLGYQIMCHAWPAFVKGVAFDATSDAAAAAAAAVTVRLGILDALRPLITRAACCCAWEAGHRDSPPRNSL